MMHFGSTGPHSKHHLEPYFLPTLWKSLSYPGRTRTHSSLGNKKDKLRFETAERILIQLNELDEISYHAYENLKLYKERTKACHDRKIISQNFKPNDQILMYISCLTLFPRTKCAFNIYLIYILNAFKYKYVIVKY